MPIPKPGKEFHYIKKFCLECDTLLKLNCTRDIKRKKFCSHSCTWKYLDRKKKFIPPRPTKETHKKIGQTLSRKMALGLIPKPPRPSKEAMRKAGLKLRGKNHPHLIEDRSKLKKSRFNCSDRYGIDTWRRDLFRKYDYTCQKTKIKGGKLIAHHIFNWADYPSLRFDSNNGIVLSENSHKEFHRIYGNRDTNLSQLTEFLRGDE